MEIILKLNAHEDYLKRCKKNKMLQYNQQWYEMLEKIAGKEIEVETKCLFKDQYNTVPIKGVSDIGLRIMHESVAVVIDDERIGKRNVHSVGK